MLPLARRPGPHTSSSNNALAACGVCSCSHCVYGQAMHWLTLVRPAGWHRNHKLDPALAQRSVRTTAPATTTAVGRMMDGLVLLAFFASMTNRTMMHPYPPYANLKHRREQRAQTDCCENGTSRSDGVGGVVCVFSSRVGWAGWLLGVGAVNGHGGQPLAAGAPLIGACPGLAAPTPLLSIRSDLRSLGWCMCGAFRLIDYRGYPKRSN